MTHTEKQNAKETFGLPGLKRYAAVVALGVFATSAAWAIPPIAPKHRELYSLDTGAHSNLNLAATKPVQAFHGLVMSAGVPWMRLHFGKWNLGERSFLLITSVEDGDQQYLDARSIVEWSGSSATFRGDKVILELLVAPGDENVFVNVTSLTVGEWIAFDGMIASLCGSDNRVASTDNRACRLFTGGCTAWRVTTGGFLTAGHCVDFDPDDGGPGLPDGVLDLSGVVEFNVPASMTNGTTVPAAVNDQYPIDTSNVQWRFDGEGQGIGKDWSVFGVFANSNTGLFPHEAYGLPFRMTNSNPAANDTMRVTGFGLDNTPPGSGGGRNAQNFTNQTDTGPYVGETVVSADQISHEYQVDTTGGNSGSPVIWNSQNTGLTVAIHTNAGCDDPVQPNDGNTGTSFEVNALETAIRNFVSSLARFVDVGHPLPGVENGTVYHPYDTVPEAVTAVSSGGVISIVSGTYTAAAGNTFTAGEDGKAMRFEAPVGNAVIGE